MHIIEIGFGSVFAGMQTRPHLHADAAEFHYFLNGEGRFVTPDGEYEAKRGRIFLSLPGDRHDTVLAGAKRVSLYYLRFEPRPADAKLMQRLRKRIPPPGLFIGIDQRHIFDDISWKQKAQNSDLSQAAELELRAFCHTLAAAADTPHAERAAPVVRSAIAHMQESIAGTVTLSALAERADVTPPYFSRLFKKATGLPPLSYFMRMKVEAAQYLLRETAKPVTEIAAELKFCNPYHFSATFKRHAGVSPRVYRSGGGR